MLPNVLSSSGTTYRVTLVRWPVPTDDRRGRQRGIEHAGDDMASVPVRMLCPSLIPRV